MSKIVLTLVLLLLGSSTVYGVDTYNAKKFDNLCVSYTKPTCMEANGVFHISQKDGVTVLHILFAGSSGVIEEIGKKNLVHLQGSFERVRTPLYWYW